MGGDYSRWTFDPAKDYAAVFKQQGRVDLDADWNEVVEVADRRWRAETVDLAGECFLPASTPNAFSITPTGVGAFTIGIGRMYVDGLLAECHGLPPSRFDPHLGEIQQTNPVPYSNQPYYPNPLPPPIGSPNATDLIYLDVWEREVTAIQDPNIREKALGGPDTATRMQTVWQVKDLPNVGLVGCKDDIPAWDTLIAPSAGRLTTSTTPSNPSTTPCILPQTGGYAGLENRLYRVEVHVAGTVDGASPAKFKWSRDNGAVVATVTGISPSGGTNSMLNVTTLGRDSVLRFNAGDWVEVLDDYTELAGTSGHLAKIVNPPDAANLTLTISPAVPASFNFNPSDPTRHTRVRRWDQRADLNSEVDPATGLINVTTSPVAIEDGIQVSFSADPVGGSLKVGDYWFFAARTIDASLEILTAAPPRGILHHYCRLGYLTWPVADGLGTFADCRPKALECTCGQCTVTVGDGVDSQGQFTDIQQAINALGPAGGVVCVGRGVYVISKTINITSRNGHVTLRGMGAATRIIYTGEGGLGILLNVSGADHIEVDGFFMASIRAHALIRIDTSRFCTVHNCTLVNLSIEPASEFGLASSADAVVASQSGRAIILAGPCIGCKIERNALLAAKAIAFASSLRDATAGAEGSTPGSVQDLLIRDNDFLAYHGAILLNIANGLEIQYNLIRGLTEDGLKQLREDGQGLSRRNVNAFQSTVYRAFAAPATTAFMGVGVFLVSGFRVNVSHNRIAALVGVVTFLAVEASFDANEILSFIGMFSLFALHVRVASSLIAGLYAGFMQTGIVIDLVCDANLWIGLNGIYLLPFAAFSRGAGALLAVGLEKANVASAGSNVTSGAQSFAESSVGTLRAFGLAATVKIHRNVFLTFEFGILKSGEILSADFSIIDNTFTACSKTAIFLGPQLGDVGSNYLQGKSSPFAAAVTTFFNLRHMIQSNSLNVSGRGIMTACAQTFIRDNSIAVSGSLPAVGVSADFCDIEDNNIAGDPATPAVTSGLIQVEGSENNDVRIRGNRMVNGPGSAIVLASDTDNLVIENNEIRGMVQNGVTSADKLGLLTGPSISRNSIQSCGGGVSGSSFWRGGAIVLAEAADARINSNQLVNNVSDPKNRPPGSAHAIYLDSITGAEISGNFIAGNCTVASKGQNLMIGAVAAPNAEGELLIHGNRIRGNGGRAVYVHDTGCISIEHNYIDNSAVAAASLDAPVVFAKGESFLHLEDNLCLLALPEPSGFGVFLQGLIGKGHIVTNGNTIQVTNERERAYALGVLSWPNIAIITSNMLSRPKPGFQSAPSPPIAANNSII